MAHWTSYDWRGRNSEVVRVGLCRDIGLSSIVGARKECSSTNIRDLNILRINDCLTYEYLMKNDRLLDHLEY